jgi:fatty acid desaturase
MWCLLGIVIKGVTAAWNHNHQHCNTFKVPILNRLLEIIFGMHTGICGYTWVLHHNIGHHVNFLDQTKDESHWQNSKGEKMIRLRYSCEIFITSYYRCFIVGLKHPKVLKKFLLMVSITAGIMLSLTYYRPIPALIILWIPATMSLFLTADSTYAHHSGLDTKDQMAASRNSLSSICFNTLTGNFGYHTAHHYKGGAHWTKLPAIHEEIKHKIPEECYLPPTPFFASIDFIIKSYRSLLSLKPVELSHKLK